jgi:hypothetical protein
LNANGVFSLEPSDGESLRASKAQQVCAPTKRKARLPEPASRLILLTKLGSFCKQQGRSPQCHSG